MTSFLVLAVMALGVLVVVLWNRQANTQARLEELEARLRSFERRASPPAETPGPVQEPVRQTIVPPLPPQVVQPAPAPATRPVPSRPAPATPTAFGPPELPPILPPATATAATGRAPQTAAAEPAARPAQQPERPINWESFLGRKMFAWLGGLALFLGVVFGIKEAFDRNWIIPELRVAFGYLVGLGLVGGSLWIPRVRYAVTVQTLCATGTLVLYAITFAAHAYYHLVDFVPTFGLMVLITAVAFGLAVRLNAHVVAVLGLLGGFLTPLLLSTGEDNPPGLFGYLALLDLGLIAVALRQRWNYLVLLAAVATGVMQFLWVGEFFTAEKALTGMTIFAGFAGLFVAGMVAGHHWRRLEPVGSAAAVLMPASALMFALVLLWHPYPEIVRRAPLFFGYLFLADAALLVAAWLRDELRLVHVFAGAAMFFILSSWTVQYLSDDLLNAALAAYLVFAGLHAVFPVVLQQWRPRPTPLWWAHLYPPLTLLLILVPVFKLAEQLPWLFWPVVLLIDLVAIALAVVTASLAGILVVFLLTALVTGLWILQLPPALPEVPGMLLVVGGFAGFFMLAALFAGRRVLGRFAAAENPGDGTTASPGAGQLTPEMLGHLASLAAMLPFLLLTLMVLRLPLSDPSAVFGLGGLLVVVLLGVVRVYRVDLLSAVALLAVLGLEYAWHLNRFQPDRFGLALAWSLGFGAVFMAFPFVFQRRMEGRWIPWVASALALPLHFYLVHRAVEQAHPEFAYPGLVPAALALPCLLALGHLVRTVPAEAPRRLTLLALFGGAGLFFITLVFPIQFEKHWLTVSWALEGAALLWLFRRVSHPGLRLAGMALLTVIFVRLALNPAVLEYAVRGRTPVLNWYLYTYGIGAGCLMAGAWWLRPPHHERYEIHWPLWFYGMGTVLAFLLLNIEIADYFTPVGERLVLDFTSSFAKDMTYSLAWGLFAFALLAVGFKIESRAARYSGMGLLVVTLLKLFLYDLWRLGGWYRIGSLVGLAVVLIVVSFIYQRFLSATDSSAAEPADNRSDIS